MTRKQTLATIAAGAAGLAAAVALTMPATAAAYTPDQLPGLGYQVSVVALGNNCHDWTATGYGASSDLGSDCDPGFQQTLDDFVNATCPCAQPATTAAPTTTTTTIADTTTTTTGTTTADTPTTTAAAPVEAPPPPSQGATAPPTTTADTTAVDPVAALEARVAALEAQIAALTARVDRLALAGEASWLAYQQAITNGADPGTAADIARGTYLNAEYGLGAFAS